MTTNFTRKVSVESKIYGGKAKDTTVSVKVSDRREGGKTILSITPSSENYCVKSLPISGLLQCERELEELISVLQETKKEVSGLVDQAFSKDGVEMEAGRFLDYQNSSIYNRFVILLGKEVIEEKKLRLLLEDGEVSTEGKVVVIAKEEKDLLTLPRVETSGQEIVSGEIKAEVISGQVNGEAITLEKKKLGEIPRGGRQVIVRSYASFSGQGMIKEKSVLPPPPTPPETRKLGQVTREPNGVRQVKDGSTWGQNFIKWLKGDDL